MRWANPRTWTRAHAWGAAVVVAVAIAALYPYRLTDGDSCAYAAMAHDMAGSGYGSWVAPRWDFRVAESCLIESVSCFHENPPGAFWVSALLECIGAPAATAALVANALWTFAAVAGVIALARLFVSKAAADFAGLVFLLHVGVMHYVQRAGLEIPLAATAAWTLAAGLRLGRSWWWVAVTAAALAGAVFVRGVIGLVPAALLVAALFDRRLRPPWGRLAIAFLVAITLLYVFDLAHAGRLGNNTGTRHGFWSAYLERQVLPSLTPGGTAHSVEGSTWAYYVGRVVLYALPWSLLPLWRLVRGPRPIAAPHAWWLAALWIVLTVAGASMTSREGSRYVFQVYVATSLLAALALPFEPAPKFARIVGLLVVTAIPAQIALKSAFRTRDAWWETAEIAAQHRYVRNGEFMYVSISGPFQPEDDRLKSLLWFHLGDVQIIPSRRMTPMKRLHWVPGAGADFPDGRVVFATPLGALVDFGR